MAQLLELKRLADLKVVGVSSTNGNIKLDGVETTVYTHPTTHSADIIVDGTTNKAYTSIEKTKLSGITSSATKVETSTTNGNIKINGVESNVYSQPLEVMNDNWIPNGDMLDLFINMDNFYDTIYIHEEASYPYGNFGGIYNIIISDEVMLMDEGHIYKLLLKQAFIFDNKYIKVLDSNRNDVTWNVRIQYSPNSRIYQIIKDGFYYSIIGYDENLDINNQKPTYAESMVLSSLTSGELLSVAFGKISKAISSLISHLADNVAHITSTERTNWNKSVPYATGTVSITVPANNGDFTYLIPHTLGVKPSRYEIYTLNDGQGYKTQFPLTKASSITVATGTFTVFSSLARAGVDANNIMVNFIRQTPYLETTETYQVQYYLYK